MESIEQLTRDRIPEILHTDSGTVFLDVWGPRCAPCVALAPTYEALAAAYVAQATFAKLDASSNRMACVDLKVMGLPTFLVYDGGIEADRITGEEIDAQTLRSWVEEWISKKADDTQEGN